MALVSYRIDHIIIIAPELPQQCDLCGIVAELRPYGPSGEKICYECGMKDEVTTDHMMGKVLFGDP